MSYRSLLRPLLFRLPPETAHELALHFLATFPGLTKRLFARNAPGLKGGELKRFGLTFSNPVGLAAGFDKDGIALQALAALGFGFIEAGTVTYHPQPGNQRPRLFRLPADKALINRAGFNNKGAAALVKQVTGKHPACVLGVSIGKSKIAPVEEAVEDYLRCFEVIYPVADYVAINVSSPNTPGLRELQQANQLATLLLALQRRNRELAGERDQLPLLVKLSPDLLDADLEPIIDVIKSTGVAGVIATNTTISRGGLRTPTAKVNACGEGGLSGEPLRARSNQIIAHLYRLSGGVIPIIGVGGIFSAADAWEKICAGASLIQLYTGFIYQGPHIANEINEGLDELLTKEGYRNLDAAVGSRAEEF